jgi:hypothetical protein
MMSEKEKAIFQKALELKENDKSDMRSFWAIYVDMAMQELNITEDEIDMKKVMN